MSKEEYERINWVSNYSLVDRKTHTYGGIIGYKKVFGKKTTQMTEILFRPAYEGEYKYLDNKTLELVPTSGPIIGKKMTQKQKKKIAENNENALNLKKVIKHTMPPIVQWYGGPIQPTAVDENDIFREWGYFLGNMNKIRETSQNHTKLLNFQIRFSPYLFLLSSYISDQDIIYYLQGCKYYNMKNSEIEQELMIVFGGMNPLLERIIDFMRKTNKDTYQVNEIRKSNFEPVSSQIIEYRPMEYDTSKIIDFDKSSVLVKKKKKVERYRSDQEFQQNIKVLSEQEVEEILQRDKYEYYPNINSSNFTCDLTSKKEFYELRQEGFDNKTIEDLCPVKEFPKLKSQELVRNFMSPHTPYSGILVYHGLGTGKTCLSIQVAETFRDQVKKTNKKVIVIVSRSILENYRKELYNFSKETTENKFQIPRGSLQCVGKEYWAPENLTKEDRIKFRNKKISEIYDIITYSGIKKMFYEIAKNFIPNRVIKITDFDYRIAEEVCKNKDFINQLNLFFSDRLFIIDEVHNMRESTNKDEKISSKILELILQYTQRTKLVLLTATPIYNQPSEILYVLNLLRMNDGQQPINERFFGKSNFLPNKESEFKKLWIGRVSYLRGENPVNFPKKILPDKKYLYFPNWEISYDKKRIPNIFLNSDFLPPFPLVYSKMSEYQKRVYNSVSSGVENNREIAEERMESFHLNRKLISNIVFPNKKANFKKPELLFGSNGLKECFQYSSYKGPFTPKDNAMIDKTLFLDERIIQEYSPKMKAIWEEIKNNRDQLIFIYSEYLDGGIIPMCLLLEYHGFTKYNDSNMLNFGQKKTLRNPPTYILIDGSVPSEKRNNLVNEFNSVSNRNGEKIQVILGTKVMGEGIDLKAIRQIHIMNPWFNFSRMDQIIGRGVRHCSHVSFSEPNDRTVSIYIHSATNSYSQEPRGEPDTQETTDEYIYRMAYEKDILFQRINKSLKEVAFDCNLNYLANVFPRVDKNYSRECAYQPCDLKCSSKCNYQKINLDTYNPNMTVELQSKMEKKIKSTMKEYKKPFTLRELVIAVFPDLKATDDLELFKFVLKKLIKEKKILYRGNQYIYVPNEYYNYRNFGMNYILYSDELLPYHGSIRIPPNLPRLMEQQTENSATSSANYLIANIPQIRKYDFTEWMTETWTKFEKIVKRHHEFFNKQTLLSFYMYNNPYHVIMLYLKNACIKREIKEYMQVFPLINYDQQSNTIQFIDLSLNTDDKLILFNESTSKFSRGNNYQQTIFLTKYKKLKDKIPLLSFESASKMNLGDIYGYLVYVPNKKQYVFRLVDKKQEKKRKSKTNISTGENCATWSMQTKKSICEKLLIQLNLESINIEKIRSQDLCVLIQYLLFEIQKRNQDNLYIFELDFFS